LRTNSWQFSDFLALLESVRSQRPNIIRIREGLYRLDLRGKTFARVLHTVANGKKSLNFTVRADAERKADEIESLLVNYGRKKLETLETVLRIDPLDLQKRLDPFGVTIQDAVAFYENYLRQERAKQASQTLGVLMDEWLADKKLRVERRTLRQRTYETLYSVASGKDGYKAQWGSRPVETITRKEILQWVNGRKKVWGEGVFQEIAQTTKIHLVSYLSQFFQWCRRAHGVPKDNPCQDIRIERDEDAGQVVYFTVEQAIELMRTAASERFRGLLPLVALSLFSGVRNAEIKRLRWQSIDFADSSVVVEKPEAKTRGRRVVMQPNLLEWLKWFHQKYPTYPLIAESWKHKERAFHHAFDFRWPHNGMRHSYASYFLGAKLGSYRAQLTVSGGSSL
jgi:integrase